MDSAELNRRFQHHAPDAQRISKHETVRGMLTQVAAGLDTLIPEGSEKSLALTKLEETMFWANAAIAREDK